MITEKEFVAGFIEQVSQIKDPRQVIKVDHPLVEILFLAVVAVDGDARSWEDIEEFGKSHLAELQTWFPYCNGVPSDDTIRRTFEVLEPAQLDNLLCKMFSQDLANMDDKHFCIDGKTARGSFNRSSRAMHFLNVYVANSGLVLYGKPVDKKTNEISAIPEALECLDIKGSVVTVDAMGCQKEIAEQIVNKGGNYVFGLKENQPSLHTHVREAFNTNANAFFKMDIAETVDKLHGREEIRKCRVIHNVEPIV